VNGDEAPGLLAGIRVLDLSKLIPGAAAAGMLAALGADVIKVEQPGGDYLRRVPPLVHGSGVIHCTLDAGKRSVVVDQFVEGSAQVADRLARAADVVVESGRPGVVERKGLDVAALVAAGTIVVHLSAFGRDGPLSGLPAHGLNLDAVAGVAASTPEGAVAPGWMPLGVLAGPAFAAQAVAAALWRRERTGRGAELDIGCSEAALFWQQMLGAPYWNPDMTDEMPLHGGPPNARYWIYDTSDGHRVAFCAIEPRFWESFCRTVGREDLIGSAGDQADFDFGTHEEALRDELRALFAGRTREEWVDVFLRADVAGSPIYEPEELPGVEHVRARGAVRSVQVSGGEVLVPAWPIRELGAIAPECTRVPEVGEHTDQVLQQAGLTETEIEALRGNGIVGS